jgi:hypothetical protein
VKHRTNIHIILSARLELNRCSRQGFVWCVCVYGYGEREREREGETSRQAESKSETERTNMAEYLGVPDEASMPTGRGRTLGQDPFFRE